MIRFDVFRFDYDTINVIVSGRAAVVMLVRHALLLTRAFTYSQKSFGAVAVVTALGITGSPGITESVARTRSSLRSSAGFQLPNK